MFLTDLDYKAHQRDIDMSILTDSGNQTVRNFAENAAIEQIKSNLRKRYQIERLFINVRVWDIAVTYNLRDHVVFNDKIWISIFPSTGDEPEEGSDRWVMGDNRDPYLVMTAVDIVVYHLYAKIGKRKTPDDVYDRYRDAMDWLKGVSRGELIPDFPEIAEGESSNILQWGSTKKLNHRY